MNKPLSLFLNSRDNNFNLIRFVAATMVLFSHCFPLLFGSSETEPLKQLVGISFGEIAVDIFFISSGFLIANSLFSKNDLIGFIWSRILRIYPGLITALLICVFVLGAYFTTYPIGRYLTDPQTYIFFMKNAFLFLGEEANLPGVFESLPWRNTVNGSLWTLPFEVRAYFFLVIVSIILSHINIIVKWFDFQKTIYLLAPLFGVFIYIMDHFYKFLPISYLASEDFRLYSMFFIGVASCKIKDSFILSNRLFYMALLLLVVSTFNSDVFFITYNCLIFYIVFYLAYMPRGSIRKFNQLGDYSYGIYIYAWPIQQSIVALLPGISIVELCIYSLILTLIFSYCSWHIIEKRALKLKGALSFKLVKAET
ncbi:MAG: acyltransferase [Gammaproteobacteria bacterium]|nr:MAG: acyltransferase [Gammaproteobacteria bacterium]